MADLQERPLKRRRFFSEKDSSEWKATNLPPATRQIRSGSTSTQTSPSINAHGSSEEIRETSSDSEVVDDAIHSSAVEPDRYDGSSAFDESLFEAFTGAKLNAEMLSRIRLAADDDVQRAVNMYLDGSYKSLGPSPKKATNLAHITGRSGGFKQPRFRGGDGDSERGVPRSVQKPPVVPRPVRSPSPRTLLQSMPPDRYIGSFGVAAWATRSGAGLLKHEEAVSIERQAIEPKKPAKVRVGSSNQHHDIIVRITNSQGSEVGRLPKESAHWVSTLIDQKLCTFKGKCVYAPDRLRTNDTFYIQIHASLLHSAFATGQLIPTETNRTTGIFEAKESDEERKLRIRQFAMVKLFDEVNLNPCQSSATTAKHKRQGLLQVADSADQNPTTPPPVSIHEANTTNEDEEDPPEEGKELEQDQLDSLYRKAQSFDFDSPEAEPAPSFRYGSSTVPEAGTALDDE